MSIVVARRGPGVVGLLLVVVGSSAGVVGEETARQRGINAGQLIAVMAAKYDSSGHLAPDGREANLIVVGIYRPRNPDELFWATQGYFPQRSDGSRGEPLFVTVGTF